MIFSDKRLRELGFETVPSSIVLLGLGPSHQSYVGEVLANLGQPWAEEVWTINGGAACFNADRCFSIADLRVDLHKWPHWGKFLARTKTPVYTSRAYPEFPTSITYPLDELRKYVGFDLCFVNTGPMALAMAMALGIKEIWMFGIDYTYPNIQIAEQGGQAFAFLLGMCKERGIQFHLPHTTSLMGSVNQLKPNGDGTMHWSPYGYRDTKLPFGNAPPQLAAPVNASADGSMEIKDVRPESSPHGAGDRREDQAEVGAAR